MTEPVVGPLELEGRLRQLSRECSPPQYMQRPLSRRYCFCSAVRGRKRVRTASKSIRTGSEEETMDEDEVLGMVGGAMKAMGESDQREVDWLWDLDEPCDPDLLEDDASSLHSSSRSRW